MDNDVTKGVFGTIAVIALLLVEPIVNGYTVSVLWGWFMVPIFKLAPLTIPQALGISNDRSTDSSGNEL